MVYFSVDRNVHLRKEKVVYILSRYIGENVLKSMNPWLMINSDLRVNNMELRVENLADKLADLTFWLKNKRLTKSEPCASHAEFKEEDNYKYKTCSVCGKYGFFATKFTENLKCQEIWANYRKMEFKKKLVGRKGIKRKVTSHFSKWSMKRILTRLVLTVILWIKKKMKQKALVLFPRPIMKAALMLMM